MSALLALEGIGKRYRRGELSNWLLRHVSLELNPGEVVSIVATRSQGKTTLLRLACGILAPEEGRVLLDRCDLAQLPNSAYAKLLREHIAWAGRNGPGMRLQMLDYVALRLAVGRRTRRRHVRTVALDALERLDVAHTADRHWEQLSDLERALVELAQAIAPQPRLLLVDDLIDGFGMRETELLGRHLRVLARELRIGVLMTVSDPEAALRSDRVLSLHRTRLVPMSPAPAHHLAPDALRTVSENVIDFPRVPDAAQRRPRIAAPNPLQSPASGSSPHPRVAEP
jgi:ABC-type cobalamin/Fe3+-siderophores transport system ATPase subunit